MKTLLKNFQELEGEKIKFIEIDGIYSPNIVIQTENDSILILNVSANFSRCGEFDGCDVKIETNLSYEDKHKYDLLTDADIEIQKNIWQKQRIEREKREAEEKRKAEEAAEKIRRNEIALLKQLKEKYEK